MYQVCLLVILFRKLSVVTGSVIPEKSILKGDWWGSTTKWYSEQRVCCGFILLGGDAALLG